MHWRADTGTNGRRTHRPTMPPKYDFKVKVELDDSESLLRHLRPGPAPPAEAPVPGPAPL